LLCLKERKEISAKVYFEAKFQCFEAKNGKSDDVYMEYNFASLVASRRRSKVSKLRCFATLLTPSEVSGGAFTILQPKQ